MTIVSLIAVVDQQWGLGNNNQLLCHLPADLAHFKALTLGKPIVMGRKTFDSIGRPLPGRRNIVLSRFPQVIPGVEVMTSIVEVLKATDGTDEVMVIGGAQIYQAAFSCASRVYLTHIEHTFDADVFFPKLDNTHWQCVSEVCRAADEKNPFALRFCEYNQIAKEL